MIKHKITQVIIACILASTLLACEKWIEIPPPISTITNDEAASDSSTALATLNGLYSILSDRGDALIGSAILPITTGLYCDELVAHSDMFSTFQPFTTCNVLPNDGTIQTYFWGQLYNYIYHCNAIIENISANNKISTSARNQFLGETKFIRSFCYFTLSNCFGDVPIVKYTDYRKNMNVRRSPVRDVISFIIDDLKSAKELLRKDYRISNNQRTRANSYAAAGFLSKVYLYDKKYIEAIEETNYIINATDLYKLESEPINAFNKNSNESILQFSCNSSIYPYNATGEGLRFVQYKFTPPLYYFPADFIAQITPDDKRWSWIDSTDYLDSRYYYPFKYQIGEPQMIPEGDTKQYSTMIRLSEIILIRAECLINSGMLQVGIADINSIRKRSGLGEVQADNNIDAMELLRKERRIELFCENGNRWFDLKRWELADKVNKEIKPDWQPYKILFPIPLSELQGNPSLTQNPGYLK